MSKAKGFHRGRVGALASIAMLASVVAVVAGQGSAGANSFKPFAVNLCAAPTGTPTAGDYCPLGGTAPVVAPGSAASGGVGSTAAALEADFKDETTKGGGLTIGSINLTAPSGVTFGSATFVVGNSAITATCGSSTSATTSCISADGTELELRGLNVAPGATLQVSISLDTPALPSPCTTATPCQFSTSAKQSNDYNGPPGNQLNLDSSNSQQGVALESDATCTAANGKKTNSCSNTLADGGGGTSLGGTVSITTNATGTSGGDFYESLDYGPALNDKGQCGANFNTDHSEYINGIALEGSNARSLTVTITTTDFMGYQAEICAQTSKSFLAKTQANAPFTLVSATPTPQLDGSPGFEGLLPDCSTNPQAVSPTVNPKTYPCVLSRGTVGNVHTMVASYPAGFDALRQSN
jgi:hypothetical protein